MAHISANLLELETNTIVQATVIDECIGTFKTTLSAPRKKHDWLHISVNEIWNVIDMYGNMNSLIQEACDHLQEPSVTTEHYLENILSVINRCIYKTNHYCDHLSELITHCGKAPCECTRVRRNVQLKVLTMEDTLINVKRTLSRIKIANSTGALTKFVTDSVVRLPQNSDDDFDEVLQAINAIQLADDEADAIESVKAFQLIEDEELALAMDVADIDDMEQ
jgi:hypothetical protein